MKFKAFSIPAAGVLAACLFTGCATSPSSSKSTGLSPVDGQLLDVFPPSTVTVPDAFRGTTTLSAAYTPSGSSWGKHLDEREVFQFAMAHEQTDDTSFALRLGTGGQMYSLRGPFGESIPPQGVGNPWNDEVWQFVAVCSRYNGSGSLPDAAQTRLRESGYQDTYFIHNSGAYGSKSLTGEITVSFDVMLDPAAPGSLDLYLRDPANATFGMLHVKDGGIRLNDADVAAIAPGAWAHIELAFEDGGDSQAVIHVTVRDQAGQETKAAIPATMPRIKAPGMLGFSAGGDNAGTIYLDNVTLTRTLDGKSETPINFDFEGDPATIQLDLPLLGANADKGAGGAITDKVAASGSQSYAIRDAEGLEHTWQPMLRLRPGTTWPSYLYCPMLAEDVPADGRTYRSLNWGIIPQQRTIHRSPILYYVQTRDLGDGIIELTYVVHNFSARDDIVFDHLNAPWGGTRMSNLPYHYLSGPDNALRDREWMKKNANAIGVSKTGGWNLSSAGESPDSPSLALVFGLDKHLERELANAKKGLPHVQFQGSIYRHMIGQQMPDDWRTRPGNSWRNYEVAVVIPKFRLAPSTTIWYRSYLVVNRRDRAIEQAKSLVDQVDYGLLTFDATTTERVPVAIRDGRITSDADQPAFRLFAKPVPGSMPLFQIENATTGQQVVSTDPYIFVPQEKLDLDLPADDPAHDYYRDAVGYGMDQNNTHWQRLLGYGYKDKPATGNWVQLSTILPAEQFPASTAHHLDLWVKSK